MCLIFPEATIYREAEGDGKVFYVSDINWIDKGLIKTDKRKLSSLPYQCP
ncbi:hypothetical protein N9L68_06045 [bacterium]|nr:hypothetical protein [bacterium]